ncbi:MAG: signal peptidase II [Spirochaetia bacterium]|nr:signal peptidase II [Spirochaetia bacterium]MBQ3647559.1 signal peptidase II [Spirochaetia bacterium]MBQ3713562.1 signal peptidase II [Spirochaetia bacterium]MBQ6673328.1 signal peptidase II [Spirochaetia bacterium]
MENSDRRLPFILTLAVVLLDQLTKWLITVFIPIHGIGASFMGGFFRIIHARNTAIAFSIGTDMPQALKIILFSAVPLIVLGVIAFYLLKTDSLTKLQRWAACGILGGGIGNLVDRIFRPLGVVDFLDVKFYGLFGLDRWPTFNVADAAIVVCGFLLVISFFNSKKIS